MVWNKGLTKETDERIRKYGKNIKNSAVNNLNFGNRNKKLTENHKTKISKAHLGMRVSETAKGKISLANKGRKYPQEINKKKGLPGKLNPFYGKRHTEKTKEINRLKHIEWWRKPENRAKILNNTMLEKRLKGLFKRPTSLEKRMIDLIHTANLPYRYVGDGQIIIGFKNPDFIHYDKKICIEIRPKIMCPIWSKCSPEEYERRQIEHYAKYGWRCIVVWEEDSDEIIIDVINDIYIGEMI
jgi:G:T-mismatch repair DNA endonuclease (very short patch repair protein)